VLACLSAAEGGGSSGHESREVTNAADHSILEIRKEKKTLVRLVEGGGHANPEVMNTAAILTVYSWPYISRP
jgi:hypothetical protein